MRRLDGVLIVGENIAEPVRWQRSRADELMRAIEGREVHLLEAKRLLTRGVIGQAIVGRLAFALDYPGHRALKAVALVETTDPALAWIAAQDGIEVWESPQNPVS
jgi:hypothetical protein